MIKLTLAALLAASSLALSGCWESSDVTVSEPGKYKGAADPLLQQSASRQESLEKRFKLVQMDR